MDKIVFKLSKALSFQIFQDKTYLINHKTKTEFLMNKDAGKILENIENFIPQNDNEKEFINQLKVLDIIENENIKQDKKENFIKYNSSDIYSELKNYALKNAIPINCTMEISYYCTLKCKHCYLKGLRNKEKTELTTKEIKSFIDQFKKLGGTFLTITGGEPFLRNDILEIIKYARNKYIAVSILTTGNTPPSFRYSNNASRVTKKKGYYETNNSYYLCLGVYIYYWSGCSNLLQHRRHLFATRRHKCGCRCGATC